MQLEETKYANEKGKTLRLTEVPEEKRSIGFSIGLTLLRKWKAILQNTKYA